MVVMSDPKRTCSSLTSLSAPRLHDVLVRRKATLMFGMRLPVGLRCVGRRHQ